MNGCGWEVLQYGTHRLTSGLPDWGDRVIRDIIRESIQHENTTNSTRQIIQPGAVELIVFHATLVCSATSASTVHAHNFAQTHRGTVADLPSCIKEVDSKEFAKSFKRPLVALFFFVRD